MNQAASSNFQTGKMRKRFVCVNTDTSRTYPIPSPTQAPTFTKPSFKFNMKQSKIDPNNNIYQIVLSDPIGFEANTNDIVLKCNNIQKISSKHILHFLIIFSFFPQTLLLSKDYFLSF